MTYKELVSGPITELRVTAYILANHLPWSFKKVIMEKHYVSMS